MQAGAQAVRERGREDSLVADYCGGARGGNRGRLITEEGVQICSRIYQGSPSG